jgi:CxxC motif-containing protein (DUF1111 family)
MPAWLSTAILMGLSAQALCADSSAAPPASKAQVELGKAVFETPRDAAGGVGPLFNATSCAACHAAGGRANAPRQDGRVPIGFVIQLEGPATSTGAEPTGDPTYGRVFSAFAVAGVQPEGNVSVRYTEVAGYYYPFGGRWTIRVPHYQLSGMTRGPLARNTIIKPRLAPALFGIGLLAAVPEAAINGRTATDASGPMSGAPAWRIHAGIRTLGRFGWQATTVSIRDQSASAFALEMGLTSNERLSDDCTAAELDCKEHSGGSRPEVTDEVLDALIAYLRTLQVPESPVSAAQGAKGHELFATLGCAACHRPQLPVETVDATGAKVMGVIAPYTDLRTHDLGARMADESVAGTRVVSQWRTAPLWGLGSRLKTEDYPTFLHDGRARSIEEAILWHSGEAARAERNFESVGPREREALISWLSRL